MQKAKLLKLAEGLESLSRAQARHFDMSNWLDVEYKYDWNKGEYNFGTDAKIVCELQRLPENTPLHCGTAACALGWAPTFFPRSRLKLKKQYGAVFVPTYFISKNEEFEGMEAGQAMFGISEEQAHYLFDPDRYMNWRTKTAIEKVTPKFVAKRIRKMVETNGKSFEIDQKKYEKYCEDVF